jgi:hypothetical protein
MAKVVVRGICSYPGGTCCNVTNMRPKLAEKLDRSRCFAWSTNLPERLPNVFEISKYFAGSQVTTKPRIFMYYSIRSEETPIQHLLLRPMLHCIEGPTEDER